ncbi:hypothetical protein OCGS_0853 [Oceaniovalibus guishaninsula JLT2003]|uniref:Uncharacterized protein n=1 Tax=Oceaniovalibus guishaninsula JLT2003 TaxID=1231392 RepID=K2HCP3_9RHOB|nr:hypothetical protein [Oceaniovalibus guishaninsula]EKE45158.1 hypothetical protein OCGS_0853 [Oceaniovalibus guishaninsula JLT2003]
MLRAMTTALILALPLPAVAQSFDLPERSAAPQGRIILPIPPEILFAPLPGRSFDMWVTNRLSYEAAQRVAAPQAAAYCLRTFGIRFARVDEVARYSDAFLDRWGFKGYCEG